MNKIALLLVTLATATGARADMFYYNNILVGDRAIGLGGAFTGVADDASGLVYNPGGLAFAQTNNISGSANAYYSKSVEYKETIGKQSFTEKSSGFFPSFIGGLQKLDTVSEGLVVGFGVYTPDYEFKDQDDYIREAALGIQSFHRSVVLQSSTMTIGAAVSKRIFPSVGIGLGINFLKFDELVQEYQDAVLTVRSDKAPLTTAAQAKGEVYKVFTQNGHLNLAAKGLEPSIGIQAAIGERWSFGLMYKQAFILSESYTERGDSTTAFQFSDGTVVQPADMQTPPTDCATNPDRIGCGTVSHTTPSPEYSKKNNTAISIEEPMGAWPGEIRAGLAWFANTRTLWTADVSYHLAAETLIPRYERLPVLNYATGIEYYVTPAVALRTGIFTNNDTRPELAAEKINQRDHVNYLGASLFAAWAQPDSQVSAGFVMQQGKGKAQKVGGSANIQEVKALSTAFQFSATHSLK